MIRIWFKDENGRLDSCMVDTKTKTKAKEILKKKLPSVKIGLVEKINR